MKRIAFFGIRGHSRYPTASPVPYSEGMPRAAGDSLRNVLELYDGTGNKGNMIHGEAISRILDAERNNSCWVSMSQLWNTGWSTEQICEMLNSNFDLVVYSTANAIRPDINPAHVAEILENLTIDFMIVGIGMQNWMPASLESLHPQLVDLLDVCNRKAKVFWVRGPATERWLKSVGFDRAQSIGCPSLFVYPNNTANLRPPDPSNVQTAVTGGYIQGRVPRSSALIWLFAGFFEAHYVMQTEMYYWAKQNMLADVLGIYDDASGEVDKNVLAPLLEAIHDESMPFASYRWFQEPDAWRSFVAGKDFYLGDRLHGAAVALQTGVPAIIMSQDVRVSELAEFFGIPLLSVDEAESASLREILAEKFTSYTSGAFRDKYVTRFEAFKSAMEEAEIQVTVGLNSRDSGWTPATVVATGLPKPNFARRVRRLLRRL